VDEKWLKEELMWAYRYIMGDTNDTQEQAGWRAFNGSKKLGRNRNHRCKKCGLVSTRPPCPACGGKGLTAI
jgi:uncharacterized OB-fold protein